MIYDKYKDSGVEWIGIVPNEWDRLRIKYAFSNSNAGVWGSDEQGDENDIACFRVADFDYDHGCLQFGKLTFRNIQKNQLENRTLHKGDLLIEKSGGGDVTPVGRVVRFNYDDKATCSNFVHFVSLKEDFDSDFLYYYFYAMYGNKENMLFFNQTTGIQNLKIGEYLGQSIFLPSKEQQKVIASFLELKCSDIDKVIATQSRRIELLQELKQSTITNAVTRGLNSNVKMKDSGVEWIGEIPEHWDTIKTLLCLKMPITDGPHTTPQLYEEGIPFVSAEAVSCGNGSIDFSHIRGYISRDFYKECCKKYIPQNNDIYMIKSGATTGKVSIVNTNIVFTIWSPLAVFRANEKVALYKYLYYNLISDSYQQQVELSWNYGTQQNIGMRMLEDLKLTVPPIYEQETIVSYLDKKCAELNNSISTAQQEIDLLKKYKQSLITEVVTGKRKIC